jgi:DNA-binding GntR family transcriptional regulator
VVASRATDAQLQALQALHDELAACTHDREKFFAVNERFHLQLLALADNRWRDQMVTDLRKVMKLNRHNSLLKQGRIEDSLAEHDAIMAALRARDAAAAAQTMQAHFRNGLQAAG